MEAVLTSSHPTFFTLEIFGAQFDVTKFGF